MNEHFAFRFYEPGESQRRSLVVFLTSKVPLDVISRALKQDVTDNLVPHKLYVVTQGDKFISRKDCLSEPSFKSEFDDYVGNIDKALHCLQINADGSFLFCDGKSAHTDLREAILQSGMQALFKKHRGLIVSNHGYHFTKHPAIIAINLLGHRTCWCQASKYHFLPFRCCDIYVVI